MKLQCWNRLIIHFTVNDWQDKLNWISLDKVSEPDWNA